MTNEPFLVAYPPKSLRQTYREFWDVVTSSPRFLGLLALAYLVVSAAALLTADWDTASTILMSLLVSSATNAASTPFGYWLGQRGSRADRREALAYLRDRERVG